MESRRAWSIVAVVFAVFAVVIGLFMIGGYVFSAVIERAGEPDQSLLFWYLPLLLIGATGVVVGLAAGFLGIQGLRSTKPPR